MTKLPAAVVVVFALLAAAGTTAADDASHVKEPFANPPRQYASAPLRVWNDMLSEEQISGSRRHAERDRRIWPLAAP